MTIEYPDEVREQQAVVKREMRKLAEMRRNHLIATGQMPASLNGKGAAAAKKALEEMRSREREIQA